MRRRLTPNQKDRLLAGLRDMQRLIESIPEDRSCYTCDQCVTAIGNEKRCTAWDAAIPEAALEAGCEQWTEEGVPF